MRIVLPTFDKRLHIRRRDQANLVAQLHQLARPIMGRAAGLQSTVARTNLGEVAENGITGQLAAHNHFAISINAVDLEPALGDIQSDSANLFHVDGLLCSAEYNLRHLWHDDAV